MILVAELRRRNHYEASEKDLLQKAMEKAGNGLRAAKLQNTTPPLHTDGRPEQARKPDAPGRPIF